MKSWCGEKNCGHNPVAAIVSTCYHNSCKSKLIIQCKVNFISVVVAEVQLMIARATSIVWVWRGQRINVATVFVIPVHILHHNCHVLNSLTPIFMHPHQEEGRTCGKYDLIAGVGVTSAAVIDSSIAVIITIWQWTNV